MDVELYVYDLTRGLAREISDGLLGFHIDAVYHTAIVIEGTEYLYGFGVQTCMAGSTIHGRPMEIVHLGKTSLPEDVILEYLASLKEIYTPEAYDLFTHNCNNFTNDFAMFLVGKGIPEHITNLPRAVLNTPFGAMLKPMLDRSMRHITQAPVPSNAPVPPQAAQSRTAAAASFHKPTIGVSDTALRGVVHNVSSSRELDSLLASAAKSCAVVFFTSSTCPPCKLLYPVYEELAIELGTKAVLIKVDIGVAYDASSKYGIRATPTFVTFLKAEKENEWIGANEGQLRGNIRMLVQMAWPPHPHSSLKLRNFLGASQLPIIYAKVPPLDKLIAKMGDAGKNAAVVAVKEFVATRSLEGAAEATLPDLNSFSWFLRESLPELPRDLIFTVVDLLRIALIDPRLSGYYAEEKDHKTISPLIQYVLSLEECPYNLRLVTIQAACNLFTSNLYPEHILTCPLLSVPIIELITTSLLDCEHNNIRVAAASLAFNVTVYNHTQRVEALREIMRESDQVALAASLLEAIENENDSAEALKGLLLALGFLVYSAPRDSELTDLLKAMEAPKTVKAKGKNFGKDPLVKEIGEELLEKGLK